LDALCIASIDNPAPAAPPAAIERRLLEGNNGGAAGAGEDELVDAGGGTTAVGGGGAVFASSFSLVLLEAGTSEERLVLDEFLEVAIVPEAAPLPRGIGDWERLTALGLAPLLVAAAVCRRRPLPLLCLATACKCRACLLLETLAATEAPAAAGEPDGECASDLSWAEEALTPDRPTLRPMFCSPLL
jgi:hypothetical protein